MRTRCANNGPPLPRAIPTIGLLWPGASPPAPPRMEAFRQGLQEAGLIEGQDVEIGLRYAQAGLQRLPELAAELGPVFS
jgi:putative ABC transport system substrate-binding protein